MSYIAKLHNLQDLHNSLKAEFPPENALKLLSFKVYEIDSFFHVSTCKEVVSVSHTSKTDFSFLVP